MPIKLTINNLYKFEDFVCKDNYNYFMFSIDLNINEYFSFFKVSTIPPKFINTEDRQIIDIPNLPILYFMTLDDVEEYKLTNPRTLNLHKCDVIEFNFNDSEYDKRIKERLKFNLMKYLLNLHNTELYNVENKENNKIIDSFSVSLNNKFIMKTQYKLNDLYKIFETKSDLIYVYTKFFKYKVK